MRFVTYSKYYSRRSFDEVSMGAYDPVLVRVWYMAYSPIVRRQYLVKAFEWVKSIAHITAGWVEDRRKRDNDICRFHVPYKQLTNVMHRSESLLGISMPTILKASRGLDLGNFDID